MARRKSAAQLERLVGYATAREAYKAPVREAGASVKARDTVAMRYQVLSHPGTDPLYYTVRAPLASLEFFGDAAGAAVGLAAAAADPHTPRGFKSAKIHAVKSLSAGEVKHAKASGKPYIKYTASAGQNSYSSPISSATGVTGVITKVKEIFTAKKGEVGKYGRIFYTPEFYVISE